MINITESVKRIFSLRKAESTPPPAPETEHKDKDKNKNKDEGSLSHFVNKVIALIIVEYRIIKEKLQDLSQTNYDLGIKYLEEGNLKEAIFRFKITKRFWPHNYEAYYQLIYCLILNHDFDQAQNVIDELLQKEPSYKSKIDQLIGENNSNPQTLTNQTAAINH